MTNLSGALNTKAKAMYGGRLTEKEYEDLIRKQNLNEMVAYLKSQTSYHDVLQNINLRHLHRGQLEKALEKEYFLRLKRLMHYGEQSQKDFYYSDISKIEISLIIDKIISLNENKKMVVDLDIPDFLAEYTCFNMYGLINISSYAELVRYLSGTKYYPILKRYEGGLINPRQIERELFEMFYDSLVQKIKQYFSGSTQRKLLNLMYTQIDLSNITKIYRFKAYFDEDADTIKSTLFLNYSKISEGMMDSLVNARDSQEVLRLINETRYRFYEESSKFKYIEYYVNGIKNNIARSFIWFGDSAPVVYSAYAILQANEISNLKHIIEGIRYNKTPNEIRETLIIA